MHWLFILLIYLYPDPTFDLKEWAKVLRDDGPKHFELYARDLCEVNDGCPR